MYLDDVMPHFLEASNKLFNTLVEKTDWNLKFFITTEARKHQRWQEILKKNSNVEIIYINLTPIDGFKILNLEILINSEECLVHTT